MDTPTSPQPTPEALPPASGEASQSPELAPAPAETAPAASQTAPISVPVLPLTDPIVAPQPAPAVDPAASTGPAIADDVDVIEKEWVDKAQEVIKQTKDDPYQEEEQIEDLQVDYLKKRYGKEIKKEDG